MKYTVTAPDGTKYNITAPDDATEEEIMARVQSQHRQETESPDIAQGAATSFGNAAAAGFADELSGAAQALLPYPLGTGPSEWDEGEPQSFQENYVTARDSARDQQSAFAEAHPGIDMAASLAGGVVTGVGGAGKLAATKAGREVAETLAKSGAASRWAAASGAGAGSGAVAGIGFGDEDIIGDAIQGAKWGGILSFAGHPLAQMTGSAASALSQPIRAGVARLKSPESQFMRKTGQALDRDNITPKGLLATLDELGEEAMPIDAGGANLLGLGEGFAQLPGKAKDAAVKALNERAKGSQQRIMREIFDGLGVDDANVDGAVQQLHANMREIGKGYAPILDSGVVPVGGVLEELMAAPTMQKAMKKAQTLVSDDIALGAISKEGAPVLQRNAHGKYELHQPNLRLWDYVKRGLDEVINDGTDSLTGKLSSDAARASQMKRKLIEQIDLKNPDYKALRNAYADEKAAERAIDVGRKFMREDSEVTERFLSEMTDAEKQYFRIGAARAMADKVQSRRPHLKQWEPSPLERSKVQAAFGDEDAAQRFLGRLETESTFNDTKNTVLANSRTAGREALKDDMGEDVAAAVVQGNLPTLLRSVVGPGDNIPEPMRDAAAKWLFTTNPAEKAQLARMLESASVGLLGPAQGAGFGGLLGAASTGGGLLAR